MGGAGAIIGGGTAWGLTRFGLRPNAAQALWFANSAGWGSLAGLVAWSGSGSSSLKVKYGLLVGGETLGIALGAWSARRWAWQPAQTALADSLVLGMGLALAGGERLAHPDGMPGVSPAAAYGVVPVMLGSAIASRYVKLTPGDLHLVGAGAIAAGWTGGLLASGLAGSPLFTDPRGQGGLMLGLGAGYLAAAGAAGFSEVAPRRLYTGIAGLVAGNALGLGLEMVARPSDRERWSLGAGLGGVGLGALAFATEPQLRPGPRVAAMTGAGLLYGSGTWALALGAGSTGQPPDARLPGGMLAGAVAAGVGGYVASHFFEPDAYDQAVAAAGTALGMSAGLGVAKLTTADKGVPDFLGVLGGAATGFTAGALFTRGPHLRAPAVLAGTVGGGAGLLIGTLAPTLGADEWAPGRQTAGGSWLGLSLGAVGGTLLARATDATAGDVAAVTAAGALGAGMGLGAGWLWPDPTSRAARVGVVAGSTALLGAGALVERRLHLADGLDSEAIALGLWGAGIGAGHGLLAAQVVQPDPGAALGERQTRGRSCSAPRWGSAPASCSRAG